MALNQTNLGRGSCCYINLEILRLKMHCLSFLQFVLHCWKMKESSKMTLITIWLFVYTLVNRNWVIKSEFCHSHMSWVLTLVKHLDTINIQCVLSMFVILRPKLDNSLFIFNLYCLYNLKLIYTLTEYFWIWTSWKKGC